MYNITWIFYFGQITFILACLVAVVLLLKPKSPEYAVYAAAIALLFLPLYAMVGFIAVYGPAGLLLEYFEEQHLVTGFSLVLVGASAWLVEWAYFKGLRLEARANAMATRNEEAIMSGS